MSRVYESLKETLQRSKVTPISIARLRSSDASSLNDAMEAFEKLIADRIGTLKTAVKEAEAFGTEETQHVDKAIDNLNGNIAVLDARIREMEDTARKKDLATERKEENLVSKIHELQGELKKEAEVLESRDTEIGDLKSKIESQAKQVIQLESAIKQTREEATVTQSLNTKNAALEAQLRDIEKMANKKDLTMHELKEHFTAKIQVLESELANRENLLAGRDTNISNLHSQIKRMTNGIREMSSLFKETEAFAGAGTKDGDTRLTELKSGEKKPAPLPSNNQPGTSRKISCEIVSPAFFDRVIDELIQAIGPMAQVIVHDCLTELGESMENFPKARVTELLDIVSQEIVDQNVKTAFRNRLFKIS
jgi:chromosome segregation ATPase